MLTCPKCGKTGTAEESELDGWPYMNAIRSGNNYRWVRVSEGFGITKPNNPIVSDLICVECKVTPDAKELK